VAGGLGAVWVTNYGDGTVSRIDPGTNEVLATITMPGQQPQGIEVGAGAVWASSIRDRVVAKIDAGTNEVIGVVQVGGGPRDVVLVDGSLWVAEFDEGNVAKVDLTA
jgi:virginiamycin B lyase